MFDIHRSDNQPTPIGFIIGYETALEEFEDEDEPEFENPFPVGTEEHRGYEEAVYDLTQK